MIAFREMSLVKNGFRVTLEWIGEGVSGDYNPADRFDVPLLRFTVDKKTKNGWEYIEDACYCTQLIATENRRLLRKALEFIASHISGGPYSKREYEALSWTGIDNGEIVCRPGKFLV